MDILVDLHTHTVNSGHAYSTLTENVTAAVAHGLKAIGITDHGPALPGGAHDYHFWNLRVLPDSAIDYRVGCVGEFSIHREKITGLNGKFPRGREN